MRAFCRHEAINLLRNAHIAEYDEPKVISAGAFSADSDEQAVVIVREGYGAVGLKHAWSREDLARGAIAWRLGVFKPNELALLDADPELTKLPPGEQPSE